MPVWGPFFPGFATADQVYARAATDAALNPALLQSIPCFRANKNNVSQTGIATATDTKITFTNIARNLGGFYDDTNSRWVPSAGPVILQAELLLSGVTDQTQAIATIFKNGGIALRGASYASGTSSFARVLFVDIASGTDYYEVYAQGTTATSITCSGIVSFCYFQGWAL